MNNPFNHLIQLFQEIPVVEAIVLGGSRATKVHDSHSDYDVYIYTSGIIDLNLRKHIAMETCHTMELSNQYWELEDDGILKNDIPIDLIYRNLEDLDHHLNQVCFHNMASVGYTTCFWFNVQHSEILFDRSGKMTKLKEKYAMPYPDTLKQAIIDKNFPLLKDSLASFYHQLDKAILRDDDISINHRLAAFLASYFDCLFAYNKCLHPGEKRLKEYAIHNCSVLPLQFETHMKLLWEVQKTDLLTVLNHMIDELKVVIFS